MGARCRRGIYSGKYIDKEEGVGQFKSNLYTIKTQKGEEIKFWGSTVLDNLLEKYHSLVK